MHSRRRAQPAPARSGAVVHPVTDAAARSPRPSAQHQAARRRATGGSGGRPLPDPLRSRMERAFGTDLSAVRLHLGGRAGAVGAAAFTQGADIHFRPGEFRPDTPYGQALVGHELAHVVQQRGGRVPGGVDADPDLEREAHEAGVRAARGERVDVAGGGPAPDGPVGAGTAIQRMPQWLMNLLRSVGVMAPGLKERITTALAEGRFDLAEQRPHIEAASQAERDEVWQDPDLMATAQRSLPLDTYLALLPALRVLNRSESGIGEGEGAWTEHLSAEEADNHIRPYLERIGVDATATAGRKVAGEVSIVDEADWVLAFRRQWGTAYEPTVANAFVDVDVSKTPQRHIWIHKDRGNSGTIIHEGMHKYADATLRNELIATYHPDDPISQLDEGITEYFTRGITSGLGINRGNYADNVDAAELLVSRVGRLKVAKAYFEGRYTQLTTDSAVAGDPWDEFASAAEEQDWDTAMDAI